MKSPIKLITLEESYNLKSSEIKKLYRECISNDLIDLFDFFSFSSDVPDHATGCYIYTKNGKKILDITGGIGVLNHGHNHPEILKARIDYQLKTKMEIHKNYLSPLYAALAKNMKSITPDNLNLEATFLTAKKLDGSSGDTGNIQLTLNYKEQ